MHAKIGLDTVTFRPATIDDARVIAQVHVDTWRTTYAGIVPDDYLRDLSYERRERQWQSFYTKPEPKSDLLVALEGRPAKGCIRRQTETSRRQLFGVQQGLDYLFCCF